MSKQREQLKQDLTTEYHHQIVAKEVMYFLCATHGKPCRIKAAADAAYGRIIRYQQESDIPRTPWQRSQKSQGHDCCS